VHPELLEEKLTYAIIGAGFEVHNTLGYGFLEHVYVMALEKELLDRGHRVGREVAIPVFYKGLELCSQRLDMIVDEKVVVEIKATHSLAEDGVRQLSNYLRCTRLEVGLLLHFGPKGLGRFRVVQSNEFKPLRL
jgi:GxxExxY protein